MLGCLPAGKLQERALNSSLSVLTRHSVILFPQMGLLRVRRLWQRKWRECVRAVIIGDALAVALGTDLPIQFLKELRMSLCVKGMLNAWMNE